ncbi:MAG: hypothetical protein D6781_01530 [Verrucomicrobia bacterium]|nr:MAG: hypothetical protein D6781_01530 [Verrucomicrobiota bacterium]
MMTLLVYIGVALLVFMLGAVCGALARVAAAQRAAQQAELYRLRQQVTSLRRQVLFGRCDWVSRGTK